VVSDCVTDTLILVCLRFFSSLSSDVIKGSFKNGGSVEPFEHPPGSARHYNHCKTIKFYIPIVRFIFDMVCTVEIYII